MHTTIWSSPESAVQVLQIPQFLAVLFPHHTFRGPADLCNMEAEKGDYPHSTFAMLLVIYTGEDGRGTVCSQSAILLQLSTLPFISRTLLYASTLILCFTHACLAECGLQIAGHHSTVHYSVV